MFSFRVRDAMRKNSQSVIAENFYYAWNYPVDNTDNCRKTLKHFRVVLSRITMQSKFIVTTKHREMLLTRYRDKHEAQT